MFIDISLGSCCTCSTYAPTRTPRKETNKEEESQYHLLVESLSSEVSPPEFRWWFYDLF